MRLVALIALPLALAGCPPTTADKANIPFNPNDAPLADPVSAEVEEDAAGLVVLVGSDNDEDLLSYEVQEGPEHGELSGSPPELIYTPDPDFNGTDSFTYHVSDAEFTSEPATATITVTPVNDQPTGSAVELDVDEDTPTDIALPSFDIDGDSLELSVNEGPAHGTVSQITAGIVTYTPDAEYVGTDAFTWTADDGQLDSIPARVDITVVASEDPPRGDDATVHTDEDQAVSITLSAFDGDNDPLTWEITSDPTSGSLSGTAPDLIYTPDPDFFGSDTFGFTVSDLTATSNEATVTVDVAPINDPPVVDDQSVVTPEDTAVEITATATDPDPDALTWAVASDPTNGDVTVVDEVFTYTPYGDFHGEDSFTIEAHDGTVASDPGTVTVTVGGVNDPPQAEDLSAVLDEDVPTGLVLVGSDSDGDALTFEVTEAPAHGELTGTAQNLVYTPDLNYNGADTFAFTVSDGFDTSSPATVTLEITAVNDAPRGDEFEVLVDEDDSVDFSLTAVDIEGDPISFDLDTLPTMGTLSGTPPNLTYTPDPDAFGADSFTFIASDLTDTSGPATVTVTVTPAQDAPVAVDMNVETPEDDPLFITLEGSDVDGDDLAHNVIDPPLHGTVTDAFDRSRYVPSPDFNGVDSFTYQATDGVDVSNLATVTVTVTPVNDEPVGHTQSLQTDEDTPLSITLTGFDVDGDALTFSVAIDPTMGQLSGTPPDLMYTPNPDEYGLDSFTFEVFDGQTTGQAVVDITIDGTDDPPVGTALAIVVDEDDSVRIDLVGVDPDGDSLTYEITTPPTQGTVNGFGASQRYTPNPDYNGPDQFEYTVSDATTTSAPVTADITVTPVNDAPTAIDGSATTTEDETVAVTLSGGDIDGDFVTFAYDQPLNGTLIGVPPVLSYTPNPDFNGDDTFTFRARDGQLDSADALFTITVAPVYDGVIANDLTVTTGEDEVLLLEVPAVHRDGGTWTLTILDPPGHGTLVVIDDENVQYTPDPDYTGTDSFSYEVDDGTTSDQGTVTLVITSTDDPPELEADVYADVVGNSTYSVGSADGLLANDLEPDNDPLTAIEEAVVTAAGGSLTIHADGSFEYQPPFNYTGPDSGTYKATDTYSTLGQTVDFTVSDMVWYVDNRSSGAGSAVDPFGSLSEAFSAAEASHFIHVDSGDGTETGLDGSHTLLDEQSLIGSGADLVVHGLTVRSASGVRPKLVADLSLLGSATIAGLDIRSPSAVGITAVGGTRLDVSDVTLSQGTTGLSAVAVQSVTLNNVDVSHTNDSGIVVTDGAQLVMADCDVTDTNEDAAVMDAVVLARFTESFSLTNITVAGFLGHGIVLDQTSTDEDAAIGTIFGDVTNVTVTGNPGSTQGIDLDLWSAVGTDYDVVLTGLTIEHTDIESLEVDLLGNTGATQPSWLEIRDSSFRFFDNAAQGIDVDVEDSADAEVLISGNLVEGGVSVDPTLNPGQGVTFHTKEDAIAGLTFVNNTVTDVDDVPCATLYGEGDSALFMLIDGNTFGTDLAPSPSCLDGLWSWVETGVLDATISDNDQFNAIDWAFVLQAQSQPSGGMASYNVVNNRIQHNLEFTQTIGNTLRLADPDGLQVGTTLPGSAGGIVGEHNVKPPNHGTDPPGAIVLGALEIIDVADVILP